MAELVGVTQTNTGSRQTGRLAPSQSQQVNIEISINTLVLLILFLGLMSGGSSAEGHPSIRHGMAW